MDETIENLVGGLLDTMKELGVELGGNTQELVLLDAQSADKHIDALEEKVEDLEWAAEDHYTIEKTDLDVIVTNAMRKMFFNSTSGKYISPEEGDYDQWVDDAVYEMKKAIEPFAKGE